MNKIRIFVVLLALLVMSCAVVGPVNSISASPETQMPDEYILYRARLTPYNQYSFSVEICTPDGWQPIDYYPGLVFIQLVDVDGRLYAMYSVIWLDQE